MSRIDVFGMVLPEDLLLDHNFLELYPLDGGGRFIQQGILGTVDDAQICQRILQGRALADYGEVPELDFSRFERWSTIEKSCWINRLYFIVSLARMYALGKDEALACMLRDLLLGFHRRYQPPQTCEEACELERRVIYARDHDYNSKGKDYDAGIPYQWFDFQPASRIIHLLHAMHFLRNSPSLSEADWAELDAMVYEHGRHIFWVEKYGVKAEPGNHQALRALALLYAAEFCRDLPEAALWREQALELCEYHILNDFLEDGMLSDLSPSYHFFECWIARDMRQLASRTSPGLSPAALARLDKAFDICRCLRQPDGFSPVISDGYPLDMAVFLKSIGNLQGGQGDFAVLLPISRFAIKSAGSQYFLLDASPLLRKVSHYHGGKLGITYFHGGLPFLVDGGCCSYDDRQYTEWFKQSYAHSTLIIDGTGDSVLQGRYTWTAAPQTRLSQWDGETVQGELTGGAPAWKDVKWSRRCFVKETGLELVDEVDGDRKLDMVFIFNLHHGVAVTNQEDDSLTLVNGGVSLRCHFDAQVHIATGLAYHDGQLLACKQLRLAALGKSCRLRSVFSSL